jgi:hypothetical protein
MHWTQLLESHQAQRHKTSRQEIDGLRSIVIRDFDDASLADLSADRRFAIVYNAILQLSKMAIACAGYRITGQGHHQITFAALPLAMGADASHLAIYFDTCRRKRNIVDYDCAETVTDTEAAELIGKAAEFEEQVEAWITMHHPGLAR